MIVPDPNMFGGSVLISKKLGSSWQNFKTNKKYNIILANILLPTLVELSPLFKKLAHKQVVISGILLSQKDFLIESYDWIEMKEIDRTDEWVLMHGKLQ